VTLKPDVFTNDVLGRFVSSQSQEDWLTKLIVAGPLGKLDFGNGCVWPPMTNSSCWVSLNLTQVTLAVWVVGPR